MLSHFAGSLYPWLPAGMPPASGEAYGECRNGAGGGTEPRWGSAGGLSWNKISRVTLVRLALTLRYGVEPRWGSEFALRVGEDEGVWGLWGLGGIGISFDLEGRGRCRIAGGGDGVDRQG